MYAWFGGHCAIVAFSVLFTLCFVLFQGGTIVGQIFYRALFLSVVATYGLSLFKRFGGAHPSFYVLLRMESFQYGALGLLWLFSRYHWIKIVPFFAYSALQASDFVATEFRPDTPLAAQIVDFRTQHVEEITRCIAYANLAILARIVLEVITLRSGSGVAALAYALFLRIRTAYSPKQQQVMAEIKECIDTQMQNPKVPANVKKIWDRATNSAETYDSFELDPQRAKAKAERRQKVREADLREAAQARETVKTEVNANGSAPL